MEDLSVYHHGNLLHTQERLSSYRPGGYHPVCLGDTFKNGRYKIQHKLGWGGFSTVWLANDRECVAQPNHLFSQGSRELRNLRHLEKHSGRSLSSKYIVQLFDAFTHQGPNGLHQCLVFELLGPSVDKVLTDYYDSGDTLETEDILRMTEQLLEAIQFIHDAGMGHGDISGGNIAFSCSNLSNVAEEDLFEVLGLPETEELVRLDGKPLDKGLPKHMVKAAEWDEWVDEDEEDLRVLDLEEGFLQGHEPKTLSQPGQLQAPETIFGKYFDHRVDLWRAGCMIYLFVFRRSPFWYLDDDGALVEQMVGFVEKLPEVWQPAWDRMQLNSKHQIQPMEGE
ncbi:protein kinase dsk1 [Aspergillus lentulus]|uniref:non-specific serine/threonine protein kinase n=1 Tax=Aspergillus lentulus TaxID=293939 RepID=A0ABQ1A2W4_ASPLE|nr:protein kinase dsk1 [Aspergillus lentulus]GFF93460.1 protein kinase dsk1 [Aspergillus lentulus]GFG03163.1 protein kinase dsk1 [Aspergillus lentulus]